MELSFMIAMQELFILHLKEYGFRKKRKNFFIRTINESIQHISILDTKVKGKNEVHIYISVGFTYDLVNKAISFIRDVNYDKKWATANINLSSLINNNRIYDFYINEKTDIEYVVTDIIQNIKEYAFEFWDSCNNMEKFYNKLLNRDDIIRKSTFTLKRPEWNLLALSIILEKGNYNDIINDYKEDFEKNKYLIEDIKMRIGNYDIVKESCYYE